MPAGNLPLFETPQGIGRALDRAELPALQGLFDRNPAYFETINGRPPKADEAELEYDDRPPAHMAFSRHAFIGLFTPAGDLAGVAIVLADFIVERVWHIGLFWLRSDLHGQGIGQGLYAGLERWMHDSGARWIRLGVVVGNSKGERFWLRQGFVELRQRQADTGGRINAVRAMVKPLDAGGGPGREHELAAYLERMERDRPGSELP